MEKKCNKCGEAKDLEMFVKSPKNRDGTRGTCKECSNKHKRENPNKESKSKSDKKYREKNKVKIRARQKIWEANNKERTRLNHFNWRKDNVVYKKKISDSQKENRDVINKYKLAWHHDKYKNDPYYKVKLRMRGLIKRSFTDLNIKKNISSVSLLGYSYKTLIEHLNKGLFNVNDYLVRGDLHIDHIIPMSYFVRLSKYKKDTPIEDIIKKANSLENLRIISRSDNLSKADKVCMLLINKHKLHHLLT